MSQEVRDQEPKVLWGHFSDLNAVPRPSKKEDEVREFMIAFAKEHNLMYLVDKIGNVIIKKQHTPGMENRKTVILQSHLDMVHQKNNDTNFDFLIQGIDMFIKDGFVRAKGTTLGADNGLGVAAIMSVLSSIDLPHPDIEALFTIDEETGMTGAKQLDRNILEGKILLNLDTEEDDEIDIGCAGGIDITGQKEFQLEHPLEKNIARRITLKGLQGGHSGMDIIKGLGNANKMINRLLDAMQKKTELRLQTFRGGSLRNAIPREAVVEFNFVASDLPALEKAYESCRDSLFNEYKSLEPNLSIEMDKVSQEPCLSSEDTLTFIYTLLGINNGVYRMSPDMENLVETSNNVAKIDLLDGQVEIACLTRSSVESQKEDLASTITGVMRLGGLEVKLSGDYPGWQPNVDSEMLRIAKSKYEELFSDSPRIVACHAGLECGILGERYPGLDMISFGPNIRGAHSPDERAEIKSVQKFWKFLTAMLAATPER
jgi:dipeptidase D